MLSFNHFCLQYKDNEIGDTLFEFIKEVLGISIEKHLAVDGSTFWESSSANITSLSLGLILKVVCSSRCKFFPGGVRFYFKRAF